MVNFAGLFAAALGGIYEDATLFRQIAPAYDAGGKITAQASDGFPCKAQVHTTTEKMRMAQGYTDTDQRIFILAATLDTVPTTDDTLQVAGQRWSIASVDQDPGRVYWELRGVRRG